MWMDHLHRHSATQRPLLCAINAAHAADADQLENDIAARQSSIDERIFAVRNADELAHRESAERAEPVRVVTRIAALRAGSAHRVDQGSMRPRCWGAAVTSLFPGDRAAVLSFPRRE